MLRQTYHVSLQQTVALQVVLSSLIAALNRERNVTITTTICITSWGNGIQIMLNFVPVHQVINVVYISVLFQLQRKIHQYLLKLEHLTSQLHV